ncbi:YcjF family protein [Iningainema tapete]|uniref:EcsC family protein n=1 Tax=Iningainema tapete BLCC-T55 TaxID=2748662 RepID=A0A8J7C087_9CYAN|nr:EcsC family protein [Iningainema tapete]MBD2777573.1 hypothetical protein [Iningainema tapete BLCC-T55]
MNKTTEKPVDSTKKPSKAAQPSFFTSAWETGKNVVISADEARIAAVKNTHNLIEQATRSAGILANRLGNNWLIRKLAGVLNLKWLVGAASNVNLEQAQAAVTKLKQEHPNESPNQMAHRIMMEKAVKAGGIGLATSILPGAAVALLAVDLAATTELQSQMVYQIAALYGLDLNDPARKGEVLAIFGLALGGGRLLKAAGLGLLRNIPFAGAVIGASSNATMIYSLGYAACRFYETKLDASKSLTSQETISQLKAQSENYLESAIAQAAVMDQILVHLIVASNPNKTWAEILPDIQPLNLSSSSMDAIAANIHSPQPLDTLINQLNRDFAVPLLAQCYRIAQLNHEVSSTEQQILEAIASKFNIDLNYIKSTVNS